MVSVNSHVKTLSLYNFIRGFEWAYKRGGGLIYGRGLKTGGGVLISGGGNISGIKIMFRNDDIKRN